MTLRQWVVVASGFVVLTGIACLCSYTLTRTGDAFAWWIATALVLLGVVLTGILEHVEGAASWSSPRYAFAFMALLVPVILVSFQAGAVVGASVIGSRCAIKAAHLARYAWRYRHPPARST